MNKHDNCLLQSDEVESSQEVLDIFDRSAVELCERLEYFLDSDSTIAILNSADDSVSRMLDEKYSTGELLLFPDYTQFEKTQNDRDTPSEHTADLHHVHIRATSQCADAVVCNLIPSFVRLDQFFSESTRVVKPGGIVMFSMFGARSFSQFKQACKSIEQVEFIGNFPDLHDVGDLMLASGAHNPIVDIDSTEYRFSSIEILIRQLRRTGLDGSLFRNPEKVSAERLHSQLVRAFQTSCGDNPHYRMTVELIYGMYFKPQGGDSSGVKVVFDTQD